MVIKLRDSTSGNKANIYMIYIYIYMLAYNKASYYICMYMYIYYKWFSLYNVTWMCFQGWAFGMGEPRGHEFEKMNKEWVEGGKGIGKWWDYVTISKTKRNKLEKLI